MIKHRDIKTKEDYEKHIGTRAEDIHRFIDGQEFPQFEMCNPPKKKEGMTSVLK